MKTIIERMEMTSAELRILGFLGCADDVDVGIGTINRQRAEIERLRVAIVALAQSADTAELLLRREYPAEASSLRQQVTRAKQLPER